MSEKIIINIHVDGYLKAETFGMQGTDCVDELDKLMKGLTHKISCKKKPDYFKEKVKKENSIKVNKND